MALDLTGKNVLIVGGSSGMGFEMTKELLGHGATVIIAASNQAKLNQAHRKLANQYKNVYTLQLDVTDEKAVQKAAQWYSENFNSLELLIEGAGVGNTKLEKGEYFYNIDTNIFKKIIETNFIGYFLVSKYFVPLMSRYGGGKLVYVSTSTNTMTMQGQIPYGPSKAASEAMCAILANELKNLNITVNVICPGGFTDTPLASQEMKDFFVKNNLPILPPTIMNKIALFMASDLSNGLNQEKLIGKEFNQWLKEHHIDF